MEIERGVERRGTRIRLILHSADVHTHSLMSDQAEAFGQFADAVRDAAQRILDADMLVLTTEEKLR